MLENITYRAAIMYINNVSKKTVDTIFYKHLDSVSSILPEVLKNLEKSGHPFDAEKGRFFIYTQLQLLPIDSIESLDCNDITIIYSEITSLNNAVRYYEDGGIVFFFHTNEHNHKHFPHIHASYGGDEISISLVDYQVTGSFKNCKKRERQLSM